MQVAKSMAESIWIRFTAGIISSLISLSAFGFMTTQESNEITPIGKYKLGIEPQYRTSNGTGVNFSGFFDAPINEETSFRALFGSGETDLVGGASIKWVPIPDFQKQPAIGVKLGGYYWRESEDNKTTIRVEPIVSKSVPMAWGRLVPYASLPVMFYNGENNKGTGFQITGGSEFYLDEADNMTFGAEASLNARDSFSYISGFITIYIDEPQR